MKLNNLMVGAIHTCIQENCTNHGLSSFSLEIS